MDRTKSSSKRFLRIQATAGARSSSSYPSEVVIFQNHHVEILLEDKRSSGSSPLIEIHGPYPEPCRKDSTLSLVLENFTPSHIFRRLAEKLNDDDLSMHVTDHIFDEFQKPDLPQGQPLLISVEVKSTRRVYSEREKTCAICFDDFESKTRRFFPGCYHQFHGECIFEWIVRRGHDSCPLCRHPFQV